MFDRVSAAEYEEKFKEALFLLRGHKTLDRHELAHEAVELHFSDPAHSLQECISSLLTKNACFLNWAAVTLDLTVPDTGFDRVEAELDVLRLYLKALSSLELAERSAFFDYLGDRLDLADLGSLIKKLRDVIDATAAAEEKIRITVKIYGRQFLSYWQSVQKSFEKNFYQAKSDRRVKASNQRADRIRRQRRCH